MIPSPQIDALMKALKSEYKEDEDFKFADSFTKSGFIEYEIESTIEVFQDQLDTKIIPLLLNLSWYGLDRFVYSMLHKKDEALATTELSRAIAYAYWATHYGASACKCFRGDIEIPMNRMSLLFAINILSDDWSRTKNMGDILIRSLNAENCIIKRGDEEATRSWFLIDLYSLMTDTPINKNIARYPESYMPYDKVLEVWDSKDLDIIDHHVFILCEAHLSESLFEVTDENENERKLNYEVPSFQIFPYEVLAWLSIRKKQGLKNPKKYTHPLMKTSISKMLLSNEVSHAKPENLPFANELLTKLKEICPDI